MREASAISGAATLGSILNSTPEGQLMFRTVTGLHDQTVGHLCAVAPIISVTDAATHVDKQKYEEFAKRYGAPEKDHDKVLVWSAGDKRFHALLAVVRSETIQSRVVGVEAVGFVKTIIHDMSNRISTNSPLH